jgi:cytidylate kinase
MRGDAVPEGSSSSTLIITIDGPAGTGKSTVAHRLAERLGIEYLDTGSMYRTSALVAIQRDLDPSDGPALAAAIEAASMQFDWNVSPPTIHVDGEDVSDRIRSMDVSSTVSEVARQQAVRTVLVERQRQIALEHPRLVTEGRDQGSVVFPDAAVRFFLHADPVVRARRRVEQLAAKGQDVDLDAVTADIEQRDRIDSTRSDGPLIRPEGAIDLDTSEMSIDQVVEAMVEAVESVMGPGESD